MSHQPETSAQLDAITSATPAGLEPVSVEGIRGSEDSSHFDDRLTALAPVYTIAVFTLTWGFRLGALLLALGLTLAAIQSESLNRVATPFGDILPSIRDGQASGLVDAAILTLIVTPVVTTLAVAIGFARVGDRLYAFLSLIVLTILGVSIALALFR